MIQRGDVYYIYNHHSHPIIGSEQRADRPAVIVSNNENNKHSTIYEVVYLTTQPKRELPTHFRTTAAARPSIVLCEQINSICEERIGPRIGSLSPEELQQLNQCLAVSVGLKERL